MMFERQIGSLQFWMAFCVANHSWQFNRGRTDFGWWCCIRLLHCSGILNLCVI